MVGSDVKKPWEHAGAVIGVVSALIAAVVAVTQQRPASAIAVAGAIVLLGGWGLVWIVRVKTTAGRPRFPRSRWVAVAAGMAVIIGTGIVLLIPGSRTAVGRDIFGFPSVDKDVSVATVLVAESDTAYRISIVVRNRGAREELATAVWLVSKCGPLGPAAGPGIYDIQQDFSAGAAPGAPLGGWATLTEDPTFRIRVAGWVVKDNCGRWVDLRFGVSVPLPANQHTTIFVDLPKVFRIPDNTPTPHVSGSPPPEPRMVDFPIDRPTKQNFEVSLTVSGTELSASPSE
jgi:hypothetical protein